MAKMVDANPGFPWPLGLISTNRDDLSPTACVCVWRRVEGGGTGEPWEKISLVNMGLCVIPGPIIIDAYWQSLGLEPTLRAGDVGFVPMNHKDLIGKEWVLRKEKDHREVKTTIVHS